MASSVRRSGLMMVGELSRRTRVPIKNLRQYADWGLIYTSGRSESNYRLSTQPLYGAFGTSAKRAASV